MYLVEAEHPTYGTATVEEKGSITGVSEQQIILEMLVKAFKRLKWPCKVFVYTDLPVIASGLHHWMEEWAKDGWKNAKGKPVANAELWQQLYELTREHSITVSNAKYHQFRYIMEREALKA